MIETTELPEGESRETSSRRRAFVRTSWTLVRAAGNRGATTDEERERALGVLLERYAPALRHYLEVRFGFRTDESEELLQGFVLDKILRRDLLGRARREKGRFRSFLLHAINGYVYDHWRAAGAKRRIPRDRLVEIDSTTPDPARPINGSGAEEFDLAFIRQVLAAAIQRCHHYCTDRDLDPVWRVFSRRVLAPVFEGERPERYDVLSEELGLESAAQAANLLVTAKRIFRRELRSVVIEFSVSYSEVDEELGFFERLLSET